MTSAKRNPRRSGCKPLRYSASADIDGPTGETLQRKVRAAIEAMELWRLRSAVMGSLAEAHERTPSHRPELRRQLDSLFSEGGSDTNFAPLWALTGTQG